MKILHYRIKYQDINLVVIKFPKKEIHAFLEKSVIYTEMGESYQDFWRRFNEALLEIYGVLHVIVEGYEIVILKDPRLPNWGRIIEDVIWCSLFFLNPDGGAIEVSSGGKNIGKFITQSFDKTEPEYWRKKQ